jgi:GNAT superfamily N-acetyltransferase
VEVIDMATLVATPHGASHGPLPSGYRADWETDVVLTEGAIAHLRPIRPDDANALVAFHETLSPDTVRRRFFIAHPHLSPREVAHFTQVDYHDRLALVALIDTTLIAIGRYERQLGTTTAEVAFAVADAYQRRGVGTVLLEQLAAAARSCGLDRFVADTQPDNHHMLDVFHKSGFPERIHFQDGVIRVSFAIEPCQNYLKAHERRERAARSRS